MVDDIVKVVNALAPVVTVVGPLVLAWFIRRSGQQAKAAATDAKHAAVEVKTTLATTSTQTSEKLHGIQLLVDGQMTIAIKKIETLSEQLNQAMQEVTRLQGRVFHLTGERPDDSGATKL
jgi:flagellar hook-associated protein FlgK